MTVLESARRAEPQLPASPANDPERAKKVRAAATDRVVRSALAALVVLLVAGGLFALFDGPVANAWYANRQHQLASDWNAQHPHVGAGHAVALLQVPALGMNVLVAEGDTPQQLRSGPGHRSGTPMPGASGNSVIVGHRSAWGGPLSRLGELKPGTYLAIQTGGSTGSIGVFEVVSVKQVSDKDVSPFLASTDHRVTIVTGVGGKYSDRRLVVTAVSGAIGKVSAAPGASVHPTTSDGSPWWNAQVGLAAGAIAIALALAWMLRRRRYGISALLVTLAPFAALSLLLLLLDLDAMLPALR